MKTSLFFAGLSLLSLPAFASESPCGATAVNLEPEIHRKFQDLGVEISKELTAVSWTTSQTADGKFIVFRKSYVAADNGEITNELLAVAECESSSKQYKLMGVSESRPLVPLKLNY